MNDIPREPDRHHVPQDLSEPARGAPTPSTTSPIQVPTGTRRGDRPAEEDMDEGEPARRIPEPPPDEPGS